MRLLRMVADAGGIDKLELHRHVLEARILLAHEWRKGIRAAALFTLVAVDVRRFADHALPPTWSTRRCAARRRGGRPSTRHGYSRPETRPSRFPSKELPQNP